MLWVQIDRSSSIPLTKQVCRQLRAKILRRELSAGERLPPSRTFAKELGVSRNVIMSVYEQLMSEGYLESRKGSGTYVTQGSYLEDYRDAYQNGFSHKEPAQPSQHTDDVIDFATGTPDLSCFPRNIWAKLLRETCLDAPDEVFNYDTPQGQIALRRSLSKFLLKSKGIRCHPEQIIILSGSAQGFFVLANVLAIPEHDIIIEDPVYNGIQQIFTALALPLYPIPVDENGLQVEHIPHGKKASFVSVTPSHQFPMGCILPIQRRVKLIEYARKTQTYIVENDYDSEFRYSGSPITALHVLDPDRVVHIGTFSESLYPALRLGYMIVPDALLKQCRVFMHTNSFASSVLKQLTLTRFIDEGYLEGHIGKMKKLYKKKRQTLIRCLQETFGGRIVISGDSTGLYVVVRFEDITFSEKLVNDLHDRGVRIYPIEEHAIRKGRHSHTVLLGYGNLLQEKIPQSITNLSRLLAERCRFFTQ